MRKINLGYSFLEMLVAMVIMVTLILAAVQTYVHMRDKAIELSERTLIASLGTAINNYHARYNVWPCDPYLATPPNPFTLLKDSAPLFDHGTPPFSNKETWGWGNLAGASDARWHFYCPHWVTGSQGNWWTYVIRDSSGAVKPGTIIQQQANGH